MEVKFKNGMVSVMEFKDGSGTGYGGNAVVPRLLPETRIRLVENTDKRKDNSPDYWVQAPAYDHTTEQTYWGEAGAAWIKIAKTTGLEFLSINIDLANMPSDVNLAAFPCDEDDQPKKWTKGEKPINWRLVYNRPRRNAGPRTSPVAEKAKADLAF